MNSDQLGGLVRTLVAALAGLAVGFGWFASVTPETWTTVGGIAATVAAAGWSWWTNRTKAIVASAAAKVIVPASSQAAVGIEQTIKPVV